MFYKIVSASSTTQLARQIEDLLHQGWTLAGGICFDGAQYLQAMTRS